MNYLIEKYKKKLPRINVTDSSGRHKVFKHWKGIDRGVHVGNFDDIYFNFEAELIESSKISNYDTQSNTILYYIIHELNTLLKYNTDVHIKTNICNFIVEFIDRIFYNFNTEHLQINNDIKKFTYVIKSAGFLKEIEDQTKD